MVKISGAYGKLKTWVTAQIAVHKAFANAHHSKYLNTEAVAAVATADVYVKNDASDIMDGVLTTHDLKWTRGNWQTLVISWLSGDVITEGGTGTWTLKYYESQLITGAANGNEKYIYFGSLWMSGSVGWRFSTKIRPRFTPANEEFYVGFTNNGTVNPTATCRHMGFKIIDGVLWATNGNGTSGTQTDTTENYTIHDAKKLTCVREGNEIRFYVNGILKATHTTNMPTDTNYQWLAWIKTTESVLKRVDQYPVALMCDE